MQYVVLNEAHTGTFAEYTCIKAVLLLTHALFVNTSVCLERWRALFFQHSVDSSCLPLVCGREIRVLKFAFTLFRECEEFFGGIALTFNQKVSWISPPVSVHTNTSQHWILSTWGTYNWAQRGNSKCSSHSREDIFFNLIGPGLHTGSTDT